ncbi:hypothetical protein ZIOFF_021938 [Zingiber officinale]|uniref:Uncharacterized protein n=1 Tax=Zingiber officinale TaxID=94328 RepID=A0A8J5LJU9_ZINOF|nr:hypothetical protein ZIOFF_021938 [Zingiber officinale]
MWISWATRMRASFGAFFLWLITLVYFTQDITLGVSLGSATQISMFVVPLCVMVAWIMGIKMDLDLNLLETGSLIMAILVIAFTLQSQLNEAILREDYGEAAKLKLAITGATKRILLEQH